MSLLLQHDECLGLITLFRLLMPHIWTHIYLTGIHTLTNLD